MAANNGVKLELVTNSAGDKFLKVNDGVNEYFVEPFKNLTRVIAMAVYVTPDIAAIEDPDSNIRAAQVFVDDTHVYGA